MELDINFSICILLLSKNNLELLCALDNSFKIVETIDYSLNIDLSALTKLAYGIVTSSLSVLRKIFNVILCIIILHINLSDIKICYICDQNVHAYICRYRKTLHQSDIVYGIKAT